MSTSIERIVDPAELAPPENLGAVHLAVERKHDRTAVVRFRQDGSWAETPDWRFHRQIMRIAVFLRERAGLESGMRVAIVSTFRPEWLVAQWASLTQGAATATFDPRLPLASLVEGLRALGPRVVFVDGAALATQLSAAAIPGVEAVVALDPGSELLAWSQAIDLGGSLDTAERAHAFRIRARAVSPAAPAVARPSATGEYAFLSHRDLIDALERVWRRARVAPNDVAYFAPGVPSTAAAIAALAFSGDGYTKVVVGSADAARDDLGVYRPQKLVLSSDVTRSLVATRPRASLRTRILARTPLVRDRVRRDLERDTLRAALGGSARWLLVPAQLDTRRFEALAELVAAREAEVLLPTDP